MTHSGVKTKKWTKAMARRGLLLMGISFLTGITVGVFVTLYNVLAKYGEGFAKGAYQLFRDNPVYIPVLFVLLAVAAFAIAVAVKLVPMIKGSGIPQTEGAARGVMKFNWWKVLIGASAASLLSIFMGLSAGAEGPSIQIGGACGEGVRSTLRRNRLSRRYQITAGASAGLAVALNAPLTGLVFAFEEAHRRFMPEIFISAFAAVVSGMVTRTLILTGLNSVGMSHDATSPVLHSFDLSPAGLIDTPLAVLGYVVLAAIVAGLIGVGFYKLCLLSRKLFAKLNFWKGTGRYLIPFLAAGAFGLLTVSVMGGGLGLIESLGTKGGTQEMSIQSVFGSPLAVTLIVVLLLKIIATVLNMGCGVPCGIFLPMLAIGACIGALNMQLFNTMGLDAAYTDLIAMISMAAFFTAVVKAPVTAIVMTFELTWSFTALLPVLIAVAIGFMISHVFRLDPFYERLLEMIGGEMGLTEKQHKETMRIKVLPDSLADGKTVRDLFWPSGTLVLSILRAGERIVPESDTLMLSDDILTVQGLTTDREELRGALYCVAGKPDSADDDLTYTVAEHAGIDDGAPTDIMKDNNGTNEHTTEG